MTSPPSSDTKESNAPLVRVNVDPECVFPITFETIHAVHALYLFTSLSEPHMIDATGPFQTSVPKDLVNILNLGGPCRSCFCVVSCSPFSIHIHGSPCSLLLLL